MVLVEEYYEMSENPNVSSIWLIIQVILFFLCICFGVWSTWNAVVLSDYFGTNCYLNANISFIIRSPTDMIMQPHLSVWGDNRCNFCENVHLLCSVFALVWLVTFILSGGSGPTGYMQAWRLILPALFFNTIFFFLLLASSIIIDYGIRETCENFDKYKNFTCHDVVPCCGIEGLRAADNSHMDIFITISNYHNISYCDMLSWLGVNLFLILRMLLAVDFVVNHIQVFQDLSSDKLKRRREISRHDFKPIRQSYESSEESADDSISTHADRKIDDLGEDTWRETELESGTGPKPKKVNSEHDESINPESKSIDIELDKEEVELVNEKQSKENKPSDTTKETGSSQN